jgi:hypothetical protein
MNPLKTLRDAWNLREVLEFLFSLQKSLAFPNFLYGIVVIFCIISEPLGISWCF